MMIVMVIAMMMAKGAGRGQDKILMAPRTRSERHRPPMTAEQQITTAQKVSGKNGDDEPPRHQEYLRKQNGDEANMS